LKKITLAGRDIKLREMTVQDLIDLQTSNAEKSTDIETAVFILGRCGEFIKDSSPVAEDWIKKLPAPEFLTIMNELSEVIGGDKLDVGETQNPLDTSSSR